jgi:hypothetical protein
MRRFLSAIAMLIASAAWAAAPLGPTLSGEVLEVKSVDAYTYLRIATPDGEIWAAVDKAEVKQGMRVTIANEMVMTNFHSRALDVTFDRIVFGMLSGNGAPAHSGAPKTPDVVDVDVRVPKASGADARTVEEIIAGAAALKDSTVVVRGKVVRYTPGVMGRNWIHLRDGSGSAAAATHDVVVTTKDDAGVGDVVTARGVVRTDVAPGAGYAFKVLVEDAALQK